MRINNLVKNHCLAKSINDAGWFQFRKWLEHFGLKYGRITVAVNPAYTSQQCSNCGTLIKKSLSTRTHICECGFVLDRDWNAAINILELALSTERAYGNLGFKPERFGRYSLYGGADSRYESTFRLKLQNSPSSRLIAIGKS